MRCLLNDVWLTDLRRAGVIGTKRGLIASSADSFQ